MCIVVHLERYKWKKKEYNPCFDMFLNGEIWNQDLLDGYKTISDKSFFELVEQLEGFYSLILKSDNKLYVAVDHIRSYPLFYAEYNDNFYLSDNAEWVRCQVEDKEMDADAKQEFQILGYVTQRNTLYPTVKQVQAGELLTYSLDEGLTIKQHYEFIHKEPITFNFQDHLQQLNIEAKLAIQKLIKFANGRQIVVPLSGGYDSRLVILLLKEAGYKNLIAFSYGEKNNPEVTLSKKIAYTLGIKWHFIEYTRDKFKEFWSTEELQLYQKFGSNWSSLPHVQDLIAVRSLKELKLIENNAIFSPGHCCVTGFLPNLKDKIINKKLLVSELNKVHSLIPLLSNNFLLEQIFASDINYDIDVNTFISEFMKYGWKERQAKFICNSVRIYEYYGFSWYLPLWDKRFSIYWYSIPLNYRLERNLYINYVENIQSIYFKEKISRASNLNFSLQLIKKIINHSSYFNVLFKKMYHFIMKSKGNLAMSSSRYPRDEYKILLKKGYSKNGIACYFFLKEFANEEN